LLANAVAEVNPKPELRSNFVLAKFLIYNGVILIKISAPESATSMNSSTNPSAQEQQNNLSAPSHLTLFERMVQLFERESAKQQRLTRPDLQAEADDFMEYHNPTLSIRGYGRSSEEPAT